MTINLWPFTKLNIYTLMKNPNILVSTALILASVVLGASQASANSKFIESHTSADLVGSGSDLVVTTINVGLRGQDMEGSIGAGYGSDGDQLVIRAEGRVYQYLGDGFTAEGELEALYGTSTDTIVIQPELRLRYYF